MEAPKSDPNPALLPGDTEHAPVAVAFLAIAKSAQSLAKPLLASGRFDFHVEMPTSSAADRAAMLTSAVVAKGLVLSPETARLEAQHLDGYDAADVEVLVDRAAHVAARRILGSPVEGRSDEAGKSDAEPSKAAVRWDVPGRESTHVEEHTDAIANGHSRSTQVTTHQHEFPVELTESDLTEARKGFVPAAMRGVSVAGEDGAPKLGWEAVGGLSEVRQALQETLELPAKFPSLFASAPLRLRSGVLLYGPPGCGKTHIVGAAAVACGLRFIGVKGPELLNKYIGASEQSVRRRHYWLCWFPDAKLLSCDVCKCFDAPLQGPVLVLIVVCCSFRTF